MIQDRTGAVAIRLPAGAAAPALNQRVRAIGEVGRAYGAPRIAAETFTTLGKGTSPAPLKVKAQPTAAVEWRLVTVTGTIEKVTRDGAHWKAELVIGSERLLIDGLAASGIPATLVVEGGRATVSGVVRRAHPAATDRRFAIVPRSTRDVKVSIVKPAASDRAGSTAAPDASRLSGTASSGGVRPGGTPAPVIPNGAPADLDLAALAERVGQRVRVGGLVVEVRDAAIVIDDGTAQGLLLVDDRSAGLLAVLQPGDALNAIGIVVDRPELAVLVDDPAGLVPVSAVLAETEVEAEASVRATDGATEGADTAQTATRRDASPAQPSEFVLFGLMLAVIGGALLAVARRRGLGRTPPGTRVEPGVSG